MNSSWLKYLPKYIQKKLDGRPNLQAAVGNSGWLLLDKVLRMGVGLFVGIWIARYLGPDQFGLWNYAIAFTTIFSAFATLGLDSIVVRDIVKNPSHTDKLLGTALVLKFIASIVAFLITLTAIYFLRKNEPFIMLLVGIVSAGFIFQSLNVIDFYFQAKVKSKYSVISASGAFSLIAIVKIILLLNSAPLTAFAWAGFAEALLTSCFLFLTYFYNRLNIKLWKFDKNTAYSLLRDSWPFILSSIAIMIYMRIDQIMIGNILGDRYVGLFSAAVRISEMWYFIPMAIISSAFPTIIASRTKSELLYYSQVKNLFHILVAIAIIVAIVMSFSSGFVIRVLYGKAYYEASTVLIIHIWAGIFVVLGVASNNWLAIESLQKYSFYRTLAGCIVNIVLNLIFIPKYGINGAAVSTVFSYGVSVFSIGIFKNCRRLFYMMLLSVNPFFYKK